MWSVVQEQLIKSFFETKVHFDKKANIISFSLTSFTIEVLRLRRSFPPLPALRQLRSAYFFVGRTIRSWSLCRLHNCSQVCCQRWVPSQDLAPFQTAVACLLSWSCVRKKLQFKGQNFSTCFSTGQGTDIFMSFPRALRLIGVFLKHLSLKLRKTLYMCSYGVGCNIEA